MLHIRIEALLSFEKKDEASNCIYIKDYEDCSQCIIMFTIRTVVCVCLQKVNSVSYDLMLTLTPLLKSLYELKTSISDLCLSLRTSSFHLSSVSAVFASWRSK